MNSIGSNIRNARKNKKLKQTQLAEILGVSDSTISDWENDNHRPDPDMIQFICGALDVEPNDIIPSNSPSEKTDKQSIEFNKTHESFMVDNTEKRMIEKFRASDDFDKTAVLRALRLYEYAEILKQKVKKNYYPTEEEINRLVARNSKFTTREEAIDFLIDWHKDGDGE